MKDEGIQIKGIKSAHIYAVGVCLCLIVYVFLTKSLPLNSSEAKEIISQVRK